MANETCTAGWCSGGVSCGSPAKWKTWWGGFLCDRCKQHFDLLRMSSRDWGGPAILLQSAQGEISK